MRFKRISLAAILVAMIGITADPAAAFELFGVRIFGGGDKDAVEDVIGEPQNYEVQIDVLGSDDAVTDALANASQLLTDQNKPASGSAGLIAKARADYQRLLAALYTEGHYGGSISIKVDGQEAGRLAPDATLSDPASVFISVDPGPQFRFGQAEIVNAAPATADPDDFVARPEEEGFASGEIARSGEIKKAGRLAVEAWRQQGFAKAKVSKRRIEAAHDQNLLDAILTIRPGRKAYYGPVTVEGNDRMDPEFIAYMADLPPNGEYDPDDLKRAEERLARLGVFSTARAEEAEQIGSGGSLPIAFIVQEQLPRHFGIGGTFSTTDGAGIQAFWQHRNLAGKAERLRVDASVASTSSSFDLDSLSYRIGASFVKPGVFTPDTNFVASVNGIRENLKAYDRTAVLAEMGFTRIISKNLMARAKLTGEYAKFSDPVFAKREFTTVGFVGGITFDSRDNKTDPAHGYYADAELQPFHEFNFGNTAIRGTVEGRIYRAFDRQERAVLAARLKAGFLAGSPISQTAPDKLFFAGGGGSVRGYAYRNIGVATPIGFVTGGRSLVEGSVELRTRINEAFGAVAFVDMGNVSASSFPDFAQKTRFGVGAGVRYYTGLGPIRLDFAVPLNKQAGDPDFSIYIGLGQAF